MTTYAPEAHPHRRFHVNPWLIAVIALGVAALALGTWVIVDQTRSSSTQGLASPSIEAMLSERLAALNSGDAKAIAAFYTPDAVMDDRVAPLVTTGSSQIGSVIAGYVNDLGMRLEAVGPVIQYGRTVAQAVQVPGTTDQSSGFLLVYRLAPNGKISHQWVLVAGNEKTDAAG